MSSNLLASRSMASVSLLVLIIFSYSFSLSTSILREYLNPLLALFPDPNSQYNWPPKDPSRPKRQRNFKFQLPDQAFTYGDGASESLNPNLKSSNSSRRRAESNHPTNGDSDYLPGSVLRRRAGGDQSGMERSQVSPYHPDFIREDDEESDEEKNGGVDVGCIPPASARRGLLADDHQSLENRASSSEKREFFPSLWKDDDGSDRSFISGGSGSEEIDDEDDDDDLPLAVNGQVRVRRGSEGYEVKPRAFNLEFEREEEFHRHEDQRRLQELGFGERLDQEGGDRDLNQEEQSWRRSEMERERRELAGGVVLPSELMRRREGERHSGGDGLRPPLESRRISAASSVNTSGDWGDE